MKNIMVIRGRMKVCLSRLLGFSIAEFSGSYSKKRQSGKEVRLLSNGRLTVVVAYMMISCYSVI